MPGQMTPPRYAPVRVYHVERGRGAEIDNDKRAAKVLVAGQRVQQAVGADFVRIVDLDLETPVERGPSDQRLDMKPLPAEPAQMVQRGRDDSADDRGADLVALEVAKRQQAVEPNGIFVRGALCVRADPPDASPAGRIVDCEHDVGVARVDDKEHG